jgi:hypothetical protein
MSALCGECKVPGYVEAVEDFSRVLAEETEAGCAQPNPESNKYLEVFEDYLAVPAVLSAVLHSCC